MTSSSAGMPAAISAMRRETVPFTTAMPCLQPCIAANRFQIRRPPSVEPAPLAAVQRAEEAFSSGSPKIGQVVKGLSRTGGPPNRASITLGSGGVHGVQEVQQVQRFTRSRLMPM